MLVVWVCPFNYVARDFVIFVINTMVKIEKYGCSKSELGEQSIRKNIV